MKVGIPDYDSKIDEKTKGTVFMVDERTQEYCFKMTIVFFVDFISLWFDQYSKYFAGERMDKVSNALERLIQMIPSYFDSSVMAQMFLLGQYMK